MTTRPRLPVRRLRVLAAAVAIAGLILPSSAGATRAADIAFGTPTATATYLQGIDFSVPITAATALSHVDLRLGFPGAIGPEIVDIPVPGSGPQTLHHTLDLTGDVSLDPNTPVTATWVAYPAAGPPVSSAAVTVVYADTGHQWRTVKGSLMTVHWYSGDASFAAQELQVGEKAVRDASALLGVTETAPIDFFIYGDEAGFAAALGPGTRENQVGLAVAEIRTLFALVTPGSMADPVVAATVPHELTHLVFDTAVRNPYRFPPHWLNEGLAVYLSEGYSASRRALVEQAVRAKDLMPLDSLGGQFPADATRGFLAYCEAASAIDFIVRHDGRDALASLIRAYKDGLTDDEAFTRALGRDLATFQSGWLAELGAQAPVRYGPASAPPGPVPPGWDGQVATPGPGSATAPGATSTPAGTAAATGETASGDVRAQLLIAIAGVVVVIAAGLLIARRRGAAS